MKIQKIKFKDKNKKYSTLIGENIIGILRKKIKFLCPDTKKIAIVFDSNVPKKFLKLVKQQLKNYEVIDILFRASEKAKSMQTVNFVLNRILSKNFNRSDLIISMGGGITSDVVGFTASIFKRGINLINIPTTLLAQVDSSIGGKTGVNSSQGKNLIGSFYQPRLVIIDTLFLKTLPHREIICGYAEILKHSIIKDKIFFKWLKKNTKNIFNKESQTLIYAIKKSCLIKMYFVNKDVNEKNIRMILNFGHTFAHAIEARSSFSKKITHGEAVLMGMILATRLSCVKKICDIEILKEIEQIYNENNLNFTFKNLNESFIKSLIPYLKNDKKNNDDKINFILLKRIGVTTNPNEFKISQDEIKKYSKVISQ